MAIDIINQMSYDPALRLVNRLKGGGGSSSTISGRGTSGIDRARAFLQRRVPVPQSFANFLNRPVQTLVRATALGGTSGVLASIETTGARTIIGGAGRLLTKGVKSFQDAFTLGGIKSRALGLGLGVPAIVGATYGLTGKLINPFSKQKVALGGAYVIGGVPALIGGAVVSGGKKAGDIFGLAKDKASGLPASFNQFTTATGKKFGDLRDEYGADFYKIRDYFGQYGEGAGNINIGMPSFSSAPVSLSGGSLSGSVGGGGGGLGLEALLLLLGLGGGYALGRRKRKRKKSGRKKYKRGRRK